VQAVAGGVPTATPDKVVPLGNQVAQRTACSSGVTERNSAVHAAACLLGDLAGTLARIPKFVDLAPVTDTLVDWTFGRLDLANLEESMRISHGWPP
jgi:hypothetical protein